MSGLSWSSAIRIFWFFNLLVAFPLYAQTGLTWYNLPSFEARSIHLDPYRAGTLWIGGNGGLYRYEPDTNSWKVYGTGNGLSRIWTKTTWPDHDYVWIGTENGGANRFDPESETAVPLLQDAPEPITTNVIRTRQNDVWLGTDNGLFLVDRSSLEPVQQWTMEEGLGENDVFDMVQDETGLWLATGYGGAFASLDGTGIPTTGGLSRLNGRNGAVTNYKIPDQAQYSHLFELAGDGASLWAGGFSGLFVFDTTASTFTEVAPDSIGNVTSLLIDGNLVWCTAIQSFEEFLYRIDRQTRHITDVTILPSHPNAASLTSDPHFIYLAKGSFFYRIDRDRMGLDSIGHPFLPGPYTQGIDGDREGVYTGNGNRLVEFDPATRALRSSLPLFESASERTRAVAVDGPVVWVGSDNGLREIQRTPLRVMNMFFSGERVRRIIPGEQNIWVIHAQKLGVIDRSTGNSSAVTLKDEMGATGEPIVYDFVLDGGFVWASYGMIDGTGKTMYGILKLDADTRKVQDRVVFDSARMAKEAASLIDAGAFLLAGGSSIVRVDKTDLSVATLFDQSATQLAVHGRHLWVLYGNSITGGVKVYDLDSSDLLIDLTEDVGLLRDYTTSFYLSPGYSDAWITTSEGVSVLNVSSAEVLPVESLPNEPLNPAFAYPNPFDRTSTIHFYLQRPAPVTIELFNLLGQNIAVIRNGILPSGTYDIPWDAADHPDGPYFCRLAIDGKVYMFSLIKVH